MKKVRKILRFFGVVLWFWVLFYLLLFSGVMLCPRIPPSFYFRELRVIKIGMTKEEVVRILGPPFKIFKAGEIARINGYTFKPRLVKGECFVYRLRRPAYVLYVYFDQQGKVEDLYIGAT